LIYLERQKSYGPDKLRWEEAEGKIRLKQYVSLRSKERHNNNKWIRHWYCSVKYLQTFIKVFFYRSYCHNIYLENLIPVI
jgi:hypothetical protein